MLVKLSVVTSFSPGQFCLSPSISCLYGAGNCWLWFSGICSKLVNQFFKVSLCEYSVEYVMSLSPSRFGILSVNGVQQCDCWQKSFETLESSLEFEASTISSFEKQGFHLKLLFSERRMSHSHVAIQKFAPMISACGAVFCNCLNCQLRPAFNKHKSIFLISKIYPAYTVYVAFACHVQRFLQMNGATQQSCELISLSQFYANLDKCG